jgi:hypothetical protein
VPLKFICHKQRGGSAQSAIVGLEGTTAVITGATVFGQTVNIGEAHYFEAFREGLPGRNRSSSLSNALCRVGEVRFRKLSASRTTSLLFRMCPWRAKADRIDSIRFVSSCDSENVTRITRSGMPTVTISYVT